MSKGHNCTLLCFSMTVVMLVNLACLCHGCVWWPSATSSKATLADLAGTYTYEYENRTVTVHFNADATFEIVDSPSLSGTGTWEISEEAEIVLKYQEPSVYVANPGWYVTGGILGGGFSIIGGEGDPDTWNGLTRVP